MDLYNKLQPKGLLDRYRLLSPTAAVKVSPICLGTANFGDVWKEWTGVCDKETSDSILDLYYDQGGNFIDTANNYQYGESESRIGDWMERRGNRDQIVLATKYSFSPASPASEGIKVNFAGNGSKSLYLSVESSLKKLKTHYIDLLYIHWWDYATSIPELMQSLNHLVVAGKVLYLGISDAPAWVVSKANEYARNHGLRQFSVYQGLWSAAQRDFEREIIPMVRDEGMALAPWGALGGGAFKTEEQRKSTDGRKVPATPEQIQVSKVLETIAERKGTIITSVALAYVMHKAPYVFPIVGGRTVNHLKGNIEALSLTLDEKDIKEIERAVSFDLGFPNSFLWMDGAPDHPAKVGQLNSFGYLDHVPLPTPISPGPKEQ